MQRRTLLKGMAATAAGGVLSRPAIAVDTTLKVGCSLPLTGAGFTAVGRELTGALKVYMQQHGDTVAGRKIELIIRDDDLAGDCEAYAGARLLLAGHAVESVEEAGNRLRRDRPALVPH